MKLTIQDVKKLPPFLFFEFLEVRLESDLNSDGISYISEL